MLLRHLRLTNIRNLAPLELSPAPRFNVFSGDNGQGKTNLLEAVYVVGTLRSFRTQRLADLLAFGTDQAFIGARVDRAELERVYEVTVKERSRIARLDGKAVRPIARYFGDFNVVLFAPEDLQVPRGSPKERRRFLDRAVFNRQPSFLAAARDYDKVVKSRNALLRDWEAPGDSRPVLDVFDEQLATLGAHVIEARRAFLDEIRPRFQRAFEAITHTGLEVDVVYVMPAELMAADPMAEGLRELIATRRSADIARRSSSVGPHRDDLRFVLDGHPASGFASQGQLRALVLAWKTAEMDVLQETHGDPPILLLDDVSSELDASRNAYLFDFLRGRDNQCFITTTHPKHVLLTRDRVDFDVAGGCVTSQK